MQSFLIVSHSRKAQADQAAAISDRFTINPFDRVVITRGEEAKGKKIAKSIGIDDVKRILKKIYLKPLKGKTKSITIQESELLTVEAQNALLKVLEEPPHNTLIILTTTSLDPILPTIISRCFVISLAAKTITQEERDAALSFITLLMSMDTEKALMLAETLEREKDKLPDYLENILMILHETLLNTEDTRELKKIALITQSLQQTRTKLLTTNANSRLMLEATLLSLAKD